MNKINTEGSYWWESGSGSNKIHFYHNNMETPWTQSINPNKTICSRKQKNKSTPIINVEKPLDRDQKIQRTVNTPLIPK